ncbi:hypothetical protein G9A89_016400 [Geosiphon pyriformis]|nr:hypothetical protein G9A89_016400 [Geosiphon pyriformis]
MLNWTTQELQFIPAMCDHFKLSNNALVLLIKFDNKKEKSTWKEKRKEEPIWKTNQSYWNNNNQKKKEKEKKKKKESAPATTFTYTLYTYFPPHHAKVEDAMTSKLLKIKNNLLSLSEPEYVQMFNVFGNIEDDPKKFYEHYQQLALTREEQEQHLEEINTQLCNYCLIPCDF